MAGADVGARDAARIHPMQRLDLGPGVRRDERMDDGAANAPG